MNGRPAGRRRSVSRCWGRRSSNTRHPGTDSSLRDTNSTTTALFLSLRRLCAITSLPPPPPLRRRRRRGDGRSGRKTWLRFDEMGDEPRALIGCVTRAARSDWLFLKIVKTAPTHFVEMETPNAGGFFFIYTHRRPCKKNKVNDRYINP